MTSAGGKASSDHVLACARVADLPKPYTPSIRGRCKRCAMQVWIAHSSPRNKIIWCLRCAADEMGTGPIEIQPPTREQIAEIARWRRRRES